MCRGLNRFCSGPVVEGRLPPMAFTEQRTALFKAKLSWRSADAPDVTLGPYVTSR